MSLLQRIFRRLYVGEWLFRRNAVVGQAMLFFYRIIYANFAIGPGAHIWGRFRIMLLGDGRLIVGDRLHMVSSPERSGITLFSRCQFTAYPGAEIRIGNGVSLNGTTITSKKKVTVGDGTMIAPNVIMVDTDFHAQWPPDGRFASATAGLDREVVIGSNVWIGMNSVILKGVTIGDNSIIGAGSVVVSSVPSNALAGGNPARVLRTLDGETTRPGETVVVAR